MLKFPPRSAPVLALLGLIVLVGTPRAQVSWAPIGPGGGGWMSTITVLDDAHHTIYAGCDVRGIYKSIDAGLSWCPVNEGLGVLYFSSITVDPAHPERLYAGSDGNGIWLGFDSAVSESPDGDLPAERSLQVQNIPNPFNPRTVIRFALEEPQEISLRIFDLEGKLVRTLIAGRRDSGTHSVTWSGKNDRGERVASGLYFCRLTSAEGTQTRKMTLVKTWGPVMGTYLQIPQAHRTALPVATATRMLIKVPSR